MITTVQPVTVTVADQEYVATSVAYEPAPPVYVRVESAMMPDPAWRFTDHAGHVHWWRDTSRDWKVATALPTLHRLRAHVECDGSCGLGGGCEGYSRTMYACKVCAAWVRPGFVPDYVARTTGIRMPSNEPDRMQLELQGWPPQSPANGDPVAVTALGRTGRGQLGWHTFGSDDSSSFTVDVYLDPL